MSEIPVNIAAQVVAAGIYGDKARITLVLVPIVPKKAELSSTDIRRYDLANWPKEVERFLKDSNEKGVEAEKFRLDVVPLGDFQSWRTDKIFDKPLPLNALTRVVPPRDTEERNLYWKEVMGGDTGLAALAQALDSERKSRLRDPLDDGLRPPQGSKQDVPKEGQTPDIHGTSRAQVSTTLSLERARQTANSLRGVPEERTRPMLAAADSLTAKAKQLEDKRLGPLPLGAALTNSELMSLVQEDEALTALEPSEARADKFAKARREYQKKGTSARKAICALLDAHEQLPHAAPLAVAAHFAAAEPSKAALAGSGLDEATAAYRLASRTPSFNENDKPPPADDEKPGDQTVAFARRRLHALQSNPSLGRLFNFVIDFECTTKVLTDVTDKAHKYEETVLDRGPDTPEPLPKALKQYARFLLFRFVKDHGPRLWSAAKLRPPGSGADKKQASGHFLPCTREEIDVRAMAKEKCEECKDDKSSSGCKCEACNAWANDVRALAVASQIDGIIDLGQQWKGVPRYEIITLDPVIGTAMEDQKTKKEPANVDKLSLPPEVNAALMQESRPTHRGAGLVLADRWRQLHGVERHLDSRVQQSEYGIRTIEKTPVDIVLDASDLLAGYKLDVGVRQKNDSRSRWHTLMHRVVQYSPTPSADKSAPSKNLDDYISKLYRDDDARREADDAQLQAPAALRDWEFWPPLRANVGDDKRNWVTCFMEEVIGAWRGDPLGLACGEEVHALDPDDLRIDITYNLPTQAAFTPPALRYGWQYRFALRAFFAGGVSLPLNRALGHYEKSYDGELVKPAAKNTKIGHGFRRDERIDAPVITVPDWLFGKAGPNPQNTYTKVALQGRFAVPQAARMIVRSVTDESNRRIAGVPDQVNEQNKTPGVGLDRRVLLAPTVSLDFAALHNAFRNKTGDKDIEKNIRLLEPRVLREREKDPKPVEPGDDYEIDPVAGEVVRDEFVPVSPAERGDRKQPPLPVWGKVRVAWRLSKVGSRPRGGLRGVDYRAAWGGFPVYRAASSVGLTKPKLGDRVLRPGLVTDEGEILHRVKVKGETVHGLKLLWGAVGVLATEEEGQSDRSGTAVFRPTRNDPDVPVQRQPYYPDPAAEVLVVAVTVRGREQDKQPKPEAVPLYKHVNQKVPAPADYPDALPVVLDVVRGAATKVKIESTKEYAKVPHTPAPGTTIPIAHVTVTLAPGEEARIRCWCVPSETFLEHMWVGIPGMHILALAGALGGNVEANNVGIKQLTSSGVDGLVIEGLQRLTSIDLRQMKELAGPPDMGEPASDYAGLPLPSQKIVRETAKQLRARMLTVPVPEIAAFTEIEAVHAVDLPEQKPASADGPKWALLRAPRDRVEAILKPKEECTDALCDSAKWDLQQQIPDAVDVLIAGSLTVHGPSTGAVEIRARGAAAARGRFDDVERGRSGDDRARGLWPKPDTQTIMPLIQLFGFEPAEDGTVRFERDSVTLLRIEGFPPGFSETAAGVTRLDLLQVQRDARVLEKKKDRALDDPPLRALRPTSFIDTRARWIELYAVAISRHANALRTRYDELPDVLTLPKSVKPGTTADELKKQKEVELAVMSRCWLPATVRPARIAALSPIPSFHWDDNVPRVPGQKVDKVFVCRSVRVRVRAKRPWFTSGDGERLGIVIWPPNLFAKDVGNLRQDLVKPPPADRAEIKLRTLPDDGSGSALRELQDADLGTGGGWVTRWGADPIRTHGGVEGWLLSKDNFPGVAGRTADFTLPPETHPADGVLVSDVLMPVPLDADAAELRQAQPPGGFMAVSLITYRPRFDPEQETWYVDMDLDPCGAVYPFVRLGLVRFQPNAPRALQVSEPIVEWAQVMPERTVKARAKKLVGVQNQIELTTEVEGIMSGPGYNDGHPGSSPAQAPRMSFSLLRRRVPKSDELPGSETVVGEQAPEPGCGSACTTWMASFKVDENEYHSHEWSILVEEVDRLRPATYPDEPRYQTLKDTNFVSTGPRFVARLPLAHLAVR